MAGPNPSVDRLTALVNQYFMKRHRIVVFNEHPVLRRFMRGQTMPQGGSHIRQTLTYQMTKDGAYSGFQPGSTAAEDNFTAAVYKWKRYRQHYTIDVVEMLLSSGPEAQFSMLDNGTKAAMEAIRDSIATDMLYFDNAATPKTYGDDDIETHTLPSLCGNDTWPISSATIGDIPKSNTFWQGNVVDWTTDLGGPITAVLLNEGINKLWWKCVDGGKTPDFWICHNDTAELSDTAGEAKERIILNESKMDSDQFVEVGRWKRRPVFADLHCNTDHIFAIRSEDFDLVAHKRRNFRFEGFKEPTDQDTRTGWIYWLGDLTMKDARHSGVLKET
jgi:hypothetical protein